MYALVQHTMNDAVVIAVSEKFETLNELLKKKATEFALERCYDDEGMEEMGYNKTISEAYDYWSDEDDEYPFFLHIEEVEYI